MDDYQDEEMALLQRPDDELAFKDWLRKRYLQYLFAHNGKTSQRGFALALGISDANLTNYINGQRTPNTEMVDKLAESRYIGPGIYDKLGLPRKMPRDKMLLFLIDSYTSPDLTDQERKEIIEHIRNKLAEKRAKKQARGSGPGETSPA